MSLAKQRWSFGEKKTTTTTATNQRRFVETLCFVTVCRRCEKTSNTLHAHASLSHWLHFKWINNFLNVWFEIMTATLSTAAPFNVCCLFRKKHERLFVPRPLSTHIIFYVFTSNLFSSYAYAAFSTFECLKIGFASNEWFIFYIFHFWIAILC